MIKKLCLILVTVVVCGTGVGLLTSPTASAVNLLPDQICNNPDKAAGTQVQLCNDNQNGSKTDPLVGPGGLITTAVNLLSIIVGVAAIVVIVIAGLRTVISAGDPQSVSNARRGLIYALIGLGVAAVAQALVTFVLNKV